MKSLPILLLLALTACGGTLPEPKIGLREANCKLTVLLNTLGDKDELIDRVLKGDITLKEAIMTIGGLEDDADIALGQYRGCEAFRASELPERSPPLPVTEEVQSKVVAPAPAYGNKVL